MAWLESLEDGELEICQNSCVSYTKKYKVIVIAHCLYSLLYNLNYVCSTVVYFAASFAAAESICFVIVLTIR